MSARDVLRVIFDQFLIGRQIRTVPDGGDLRAARPIDQRQFGIDQVGHLGGDGIRQPQQLRGHGEESHVAEGRFFKRCAFQRRHIAGSWH